MARLNPPRQMKDVVHVILGDSAGGSSRQGGARIGVSLRDPLCPGPCDIDSTIHQRKRHCFWNQVYQIFESPNSKKKLRWGPKQTKNWKFPTGTRSFLAHLNRFPENLPIILWTIASWSERLSFWWILDALQRGSFNLDRVWVGEPRWAEPFSSEDYLYSSLGQCGYQCFPVALESLVPLRSTVVRAGARLWQQFSAHAPLAFDRARRKGRSAFPELSRIAERYKAYFPRVANTKQARIRLSDSDQLLFDRLQSNQWLKPVDFLKGADYRWVNRLLCDGDLWFLYRLQQWGKHQHRNPAIEVRYNQKVTNLFVDVEYKITSHGERLRDEGIQTPDEAPSMYIGGCKLYAKDPFWVRRNQGDDWWIEEWKGHNSNTR